MSARNGKRGMRSDDHGTWSLQDAKARLSELVRQAQNDGPQTITIHGKETAVIMDAEEYRRFKRPLTGQDLIDACAASPHKEIDLTVERVRVPLRVRKLNLD